MNLNEILNVVTYLVNLTGGERRAVTPGVFTNVLTRVNLEYYYDQIRRENYDYLRPFLVILGDENNPAVPVDRNGEADAPIDLYKPVSVTYRYATSSGVKIRPVLIKDEATFDSLLGDPIEYPTKEYPICSFRSGIIKVAPAGIRYIGLKYYKIPSTPQYAVKVVGGVNVYDEENSVELEWAEPDQVHIIGLLLRDMGYHVSTEAIQEAVKKQNAQQ